MARLPDPWPDDDEDLVVLQEHLARSAAERLVHDPWRPGPGIVVGGCFVAFARGEEGPGHPGDRAWAGAVTWRPPHQGGPAGGGGDGARPSEPTSRPAGGGSRQVLARAVVAQAVPAAYTPVLLARREGPILQACLDALDRRPDVVLVDATGLDHARRAGLALHVGAAIDVPTVGVTHRGLVVVGRPPSLARRGAVEVVHLDGVPVGAWLCTRTGARPLLVHAAWRTDVDTAVEVVLRSSTGSARTPAPLQEARRAAREARSLAGAGRHPVSG